jgi:hypothetical protein
VVGGLSSGEINPRGMSQAYATRVSIIPLFAPSFAILRFFGRYLDLVPILPPGRRATDLSTRRLEHDARIHSGASRQYRIRELRQG